MKQKLLNKLWLRVGMIVAVMTTALAGTVKAESYEKDFSNDDLEDMLYGSYLDASSYWKVPETAGNTAIITIPITSQPTSGITITFNIATFGSGTNPSSSNTTITAVGTESGSNWSGSGVSTYPSSSTFVNGVMTITKPNSPTTLSGLEITMGVNSGVKIFRLKSITISYTTGSSSTTYSVTYDANGGTGTMTDSKSPYSSGASVTVLGNSFNRDGYTFSKWNTAANGSGTDYHKDDTFIINTNTTLYAQWEEQS
ncbi:MAG: InlB B-repeat-containing protein, partial [Bacteroidaceae bacterium]|nr:InlB B-repeat-containing protein [Bacteroidaceae bacterium]